MEVRQESQEGFQRMPHSPGGVRQGTNLRYLAKVTSAACRQLPDEQLPTVMSPKGEAAEHIAKISDLSIFSEVFILAVLVIGQRLYPKYQCASPLAGLDGMGYKKPLR